MRRFFVDQKNIKDDVIEITGSQFEHLFNVLRMRENDKIVCFCANGKDYFCKIAKITVDSALCQIEKIEESQKTPVHNVTLFQGALKNDKFEFLIQKMSELGLFEIIPFESGFSVAKIRTEKTQRYQKIAQEASKQCTRADVLNVGEPLTFKNMLTKLKEYDLVLFAYEKETQSSISSLQLENFKKIAFIVGSEGGFSDKESQMLKEAGAKTITLGKRILRAETATITLASIIMFLLGELG